MIKKTYHLCQATAPVWAVSLFLGACSLSPDPIGYDKGYDKISHDAESIFDGQEAVVAPITLEEAVARTLKYNLQMRLAAMEEVVASTQLSVDKLALLPQIIGNAGYSLRDNRQTSKSASVIGGRVIPGLTPSTSVDRELFVGDIAFNWNILDFGLSYFTAKQSADRFLIAKENRRRTVQNIVREVEQSFWSAASAQALTPQVNNILSRVEDALSSLIQQRRRSLSNPLSNLRDREALIEIERVIRTIKAELDLARVSLASLLSLPIGADFELAMPNDYLMEIPKIALTVENLVDIALRRRPDVRAQLYGERIDSIEIKKVFTSMLPGLNFTGGSNYTSNTFDVNSSWLQAAAKVNWNLMNLISGPKRIELARDKKKLGQRRKMAVIMAAITQVNLAWRQHVTQKELFAQSIKFNEVEREIQSVIDDALRAGDANELEAIQAHARALAAQLELDRRYSGLRDSLTVIYASLGLDPLPSTVADHDVATLTDAVERANDLRGRILSGEISVKSMEGEEIIPATHHKTAKPPKADTSSQAASANTWEEEPYEEEVMTQETVYEEYYTSAPEDGMPPSHSGLFEPRITEDALEEADKELPYYSTPSSSWNNNKYRGKGDYRRPASATRRGPSSRQQAPAPRESGYSSTPSALY